MAASKRSAKAKPVAGSSRNIPAAATFFPTPADFRAWLTKHHKTVPELLGGFYKVETQKPSITWPESVDEALSFGWIDGIRRSLGAESYTIRFTPRKAGSIWSTVNVARAKELIRQRRMRAAGKKAYDARKEYRSGIYSYEQRSVELPEPYSGTLRRNAKAWKYFNEQAPWYRRVMMWRIVSAKREETREKRLRELIELCEQSRRHPAFDRKPKG